MWIFYALGSAFAQALRNMAMKRIGHVLDDTINVWGRFALIVPFAGAAVYLRGAPELKEGFWLICLGFACTQIAATLSLSRALKLTEISLVTTLWKLSLVFLTGWGFLSLGERPSLLGLVGVLCCAGGVYVVNIHKSRIAWWSPLAALVQERGQLWALISALLFAPSVVLIKQLSLLSDPYYASLMGYALGAVLLTPYTVYRSRRNFLKVGRCWKDFLGMGLFASVSSILGASAYTMTLSAYAEAIKQVEILFALLVGVVVFGEKARVKVIWPGSLLMLLGMAIISLWG